ncbi:LOW QUALITY PROTEIN: glycine N-phenylacetyltransferase-like [Rhynchonycteris naso]
MVQLQGPHMLQMLEKSLRKLLPESLKVYGTTFNMNRGNPFKLKTLVDKWPDFNTVVVCPQEEMTDDFDHYTNTYVIYSKDPKNCQESLSTSDVINWRQHLQIQSKKYRISNDEKFKLSSLNVAHAALVNKFWHFCGNERSQRFIEHCIENFPMFCVMGPKGTPFARHLLTPPGSGPLHLPGEGDSQQRPPCLARGAGPTAAAHVVLSAPGAAVTRCLPRNPALRRDHSPRKARPRGSSSTAPALLVTLRQLKEGVEVRDLAGKAEGGVDRMDERVYR